jgi:Putative auto-transporter adhesin, head GIN domain
MTVAPTPVHAGPEHRRSAWLAIAALAVVAGGLAVALLYHYDVFGSSSSSGVEGSGVPATQTREVAPFSGVELAGANNVIVHVGETQSVVVHADDNLLDRVTTEVQSGRLVIGNEPGSFSTKSPMVVEIAVPSLDALTLSGSGNISVEGVAAKSLDVSLPGSGMLSGAGSADRLDVTVGGSGTVQFTELAAKHVRAGVSGSGSIFVTATESLAASVSGSGAIIYAGSPGEVTRDITGSGAITAG